MDATNVPAFLNHAYFKTALENGLKRQNLKVTDLKFSMGSGPGENFLSCVYRVSVTFAEGNSSSKTVSLIVKVVPDIPLFAGGVDMHKKESLVYFNILPEMEKGMQGRFSPKAYYSVLEEPKTIVLEDLKVSEYRLGNRHQGLDEDHCKIVLEKLGQFHALSMLYGLKHPEDMKLFYEGIITPQSIKTEAFEMTQGRNFRSTVRLAESWPEYVGIASKMSKIQSEFADRLLASVDCAKDTFKVLNHGDMWVNNLLFKYGSNGKPEDVIFVDYQCCVYGSPANDINHFLGTSPTPDVLRNRHEHLIKVYYYQSFKRTLQNAGYDKIPSEDFIMGEVRRKEFFAVGLAISLLPILSMDINASKENTFDNLATGKSGSSLDHSVLAPRFQQAMRYLLKHADERKLFD